MPLSTLPDWLAAFAKVSPVTLTANAARSLALVPGTPSSLGGAIAWIVGLLAVFIPLSVCLPPHDLRPPRITVIR